ncbi:hypothetical protein HN51_027381 [Arachis hypogaea]
MPTMKQLIRNTRQPIRNVTKSPALRGCPQRRGTCTMKSNHLNLQFKMRQISPLNGLRGSATQLICILKYRYFIARFRCERPILLDISWVEPKSVNCTS